MKHLLLFTALITFSLPLFAPLSAQAQSATDETIKTKLETFTRAFSYTRFFHPSDQAALVDWEAMAYYGVEQCLASPELESTKDLIQRLFDPVVVDLELYEGEEKERPATDIVKSDEVIAWQHLGVGLGGAGGLYKSIRLNRNYKVSKRAGGPFGNLLMGLDPTEYRGKEIRFRFDAKIEEGRCRLQGWWRVDRESKKRGLFDNMTDRPIKEKEWQEYELIGTVDDDASRLSLGVLFFGSGSGLVDNVRLEQKEGDQWQTIDVPNADFEKGELKPESWMQPVYGYELASTSDDVTHGKKAVRIGTNSSEVLGKPIFKKVPALGEVVDAKIATNLRIRFPLALPIAHEYTKGDNAETDKHIEAINASKTNDAQQAVASAANVVLLWTVFQHFYPYFDQVECDWDAALTTAIEKSYKLEDRQAATKNLQWLVAQLHDGHGNVFDVKSQVLVAPVQFDWIEEQLMVVASDDDKFKVGDIVIEIDDKSAVDHLRNMESFISGSPQWKRYRSTSRISQGKQSKTLKIKRGDEEFELQLEFKGRQQAATDKGDVCRIVVDNKDDEEDIWFIDMGRAEPKDVDPLIEKFATAKGIVLDFRGYPRGTQYLFQHMSDKHMQSQKWQVPQQIRPDRSDMTDFRTSGRWQMPPRNPRFAGKMVFITNGSAISYAESCMSIVANYKLGEIIGSPTAGANGNVNPFALPGGYQISWTGMRVVNHDDSQHHVAGVQVTIPMKPTIAGVREGRDELLEAAVKLIQEQ